MTSVPQQAEAFQRILEEEAVPLAKETGFIERERAFTGTLLTREFFWIQSNRPVCCQIRGEEVSSALRRMARGQYFPRQQSTGNGADFAQALILGWLQRPDERLEGFTQILQRREVSITASGLSQRFTKEAATFMQRLLERLAEEQMQVEAVDVPLLRRFSAVMVEDSSSVLLPPELAGLWHGCGGSAGMSEAAIKLFVRWDVLRGKLEGPRLTDGRHSDNKSPFNDDDLPAGGLYLADLGFFALWRLCRLAKRRPDGKRFFVMRLHYGTGLYTRSGHQIELRGILPQQEGEAKEVGVLVGKQAQLLVRLIMVRVSEEVAEQRRKRIREAARDHGREACEEVLYLAGWTIVVTNVPRARLSLPEALVLLRLRWQIERLFRLWKEHGQSTNGAARTPGASCANCMASWRPCSSSSGSSTKAVGRIPGAA